MRRVAEEPPPRGHIALYARDARWRRSVTQALAAGGHSHEAAASAVELHRLLHSQRFDVVALKVRSDEDAEQLASVLSDAPLPQRGILVGHASALSLVPDGQRHAAFQFVPGRPDARQVCQLVDASIGAGGWDEGNDEIAVEQRVEEIDLGEAIERAAAVVYPQAKRRRQRFSTLVEGPTERALADPIKIRRAFIALLRMLVTLTPVGALVSVEARAGRDDWTIRFQASSNGRRVTRSPHLADSLREEVDTLSSVARDIASQGGVLWTELAGSSTLALCLTLPLPPATASVASRRRGPVELPVTPPPAAPLQKRR